MRNYRMDNIRCILIFLVVFGHMLAWIPDADSLYRIIYLFHMPAFLFLTGYFSHFNFAKILTQLVYPYVLFQVLYLLFDTLVFRDAPIRELVLQFTTPYWILWYLLATTFYRLLIPLLDKAPRFVRPVVFAASVALALLSGFVPEFGYYLSAGRFFSFLPYFLSGYYLARSKWFPTWLERPLASIQKWPLALLGTGIALWSCLREKHFSANMLYGSFPYEQAHFGPEDRLMMMLFAFGWILALLTLVPNRHIPGISTAGGGTLPIYLLHGFLVRLMAKYHVFCFSRPVNLLFALAVSIAIVATLGNHRVHKPLHTILTGGWVEKLWRKYVLT